tara:strand:- start:355 stop:744 length:390 start_codon:yes stop_codon:yes gene_type:complete
MGAIWETKFLEDVLNHPGVNALRTPEGNHFVVHSDKSEAGSWNRTYVDGTYYVGGVHNHPPMGIPAVLRVPHRKKLSRKMFMEGFHYFSEFARKFAAHPLITTLLDTGVLEREGVETPYQIFVQEQGDL